MATYTKETLSASTGGQPIKITTTSSPGTTIHTTQISSDIKDEIWLYATNTSISTVAVTLQYGGTSNPDDSIIVGIPAQTGLSLILPGIILNGDGTNGRVIRAYAGTGNVINIVGYVNRIS
jgi:hypothetical protein